MEPVEAVNINQHKKFSVQASRYLTVFEEFDTVEEASRRAAELAAEDYDVVSIRNQENDNKEIW